MSPEELRSALASLRLSQRAFGRLSGIGESMARKMCRGAAPITFEVCSWIGHALDVDRRLAAATSGRDVSQDAA